MKIPTFFDKIKQKFAKKSKIYNKKPFFSIGPKYVLKSFLIWIGVMRHEDFIDDIVRDWNKQLVKWILEIFVTGFLIQIALLPFIKYELSFKLIFNIFALGVFAFVVTQTWKGIVDGMCKYARSYPKK